MKRSKYISFLLVTVMLFTSLAIPMQASAEINYDGLNKHQSYYLRLLGSLSRADYYENDILASVTLSQAIYEGGWGRYSLPVGGNNLFGIKAYNTWKGQVYDQNTSLLYSSYNDYLIAVGQMYSNKISEWRAHKNWAESVDSHSSLFLNESKYAAVVGEKDYAVALREIVAAGYCSDNGYAETAIKIIEQYGLTAYDDLTPDEDGIVALTCDDERIRIASGETYSLAVTYYPSDKTPSSLKWASDNTAVATVDENGVVTGVSQGMALITATLANGREACCIVYVDCNATIIDSDVYVRKSPSTSAETNGKVYRGYPVNVTSDKLYSDSEGNLFYAVTGHNNSGKLVSGYVLSDYVYLNQRNVQTIAVVSEDITIKAGDTYTVLTSVVPADAMDRELSWSSSDTSVATVDENGVITAIKNGSAVITAKAAGGAERKINVTVASKKFSGSAVITASPKIAVRSSASQSSSSLGYVEFLSKVTVNGTPEGHWYNITATTTSGKTVTGYVLSIYVQFARDNSISYSSAGSNLTVYKTQSSASAIEGIVNKGEELVILGKETDGWSYIVSLGTNGEAVYGYAKLDGSANTTPGVSGGESGGGTSGDVGVGSEPYYYAITTSDINIRSGAGTSYDSLGRVNLGDKISITGEPIKNGSYNWYKVCAKTTAGETVIGYAAAEYLTLLYKGVTNQNLNVRTGAGTTYGSVGRLELGTDVIIFGMDTTSADGYDWGNVEGETSSGTTINGYAAMKFITIEGQLPAPTPENENTNFGEFEIIDSSLTIKDSVLNGVKSNTKVSDLLKCFKGEVEILNASGATLSGDKTVGTGCQIQVTNDGVASIVAVVVIKGDVNGDGDISSQDYVAIKRALFNTSKLENAFLKAGLISDNSELDVTDYVLLKRHCFGTYAIK